MAAPSSCVARSAGGSLDPQVNYTLQYWQLYRGTQDGLVAFKAAGGKAAFEKVPDLAVAIPKPSDGGRTWTFTLRKGIRYSNGKPVQPRDVLWTFQRIFKVRSPTAGSFYGVLAGAGKCLETPATCDLSNSVVVDARKHTVTFHLTRPDAEWLDKLAVPHAALLPWGTPNRDLGTRLPPGTGAYRFTRYDPNRELVLERNPHFRQWSADAQPDGYVDRIAYRFGGTVEAHIAQIRKGTADWTLESPSADRLSELAIRYPRRVHVNTQLANWYLPMNVNLAPFDDRRARQAVNYAIDRNAAVRILGGSRLAIPSCQVLPAGFPARVDYCPYTKRPGKRWTAPDLARAKALVKQSGTTGARVAVVVSDDAIGTALGRYVRGVLNSIGYRASVKGISGNTHFTYIQNTNNKVQISVTQWYQDYPQPSDFLYVLLGCESFRPGTDASVNIAGYCNERIDDQMQEALSLGITDPDAALVLWTKIDRALTDEAPHAVLLNPRQVNFLSQRVGNFVWSSQSYMLFSKAWVR